MRDDERFVQVYKEGSSLSEAGVRQILLDTWTGVHYLTWRAGESGGITPLLDSDGKPVVTQPK